MGRSCEIENNIFAFNDDFLDTEWTKLDRMRQKPRSKQMRHWLTHKILLSGFHNIIGSISLKVVAKMYPQPSHNGTNRNWYTKCVCLIDSLFFIFYLIKTGQHFSRKRCSIGLASLLLFSIIRRSDWFKICVSISAGTGYIFLVKCYGECSDVLQFELQKHEYKFGRTRRFNTPIVWNSRVGTKTNSIGNTIITFYGNYWRSNQPAYTCRDTTKFWNQAGEAITCNHTLPPSLHLIPNRRLSRSPKKKRLIAG